MIALWPWLTFLSLMIYQISMRKAKVKFIHVARCVTYSSDFVIWMAIAVLACLGSHAAMSRLGPGINVLTVDDFTTKVDAAATWVWLFACLVFSYRMAMAYRYYLRFPHAVATVLLSQVMVALFALAVLSFAALR